MKIDARGKQCPLPVMDAKEGLKRQRRERSWRYAWTIRSRFRT